MAPSPSAACGWYACSPQSPRATPSGSRSPAEVAFAPRATASESSVSAGYGPASGAKAEAAPPRWVEERPGSYAPPRSVVQPSAVQPGETASQKPVVP